MIRVLHFSDVHLTASPLGWRTRDYFSKRVLGYANVKILGRGYRFRHAPQVTDAMMARARELNYDLMIFSGDATKLAFESEFEHAASRLGVQDSSLPNGFAVPGNHDYYTRRCARLGLFEKHFAPWLAGVRVGSHAYPFARKIGPAWFIGLNSCHPRRINYAACGMAGNDQLERLRELCSKLDAGPRLLVTHYPLRDSHKRVERRTHRLIDHRETLQAAKDVNIQLWMHGHIHRPFMLEPHGAIPFPLICVGSATQTRRWSHNEYEIDTEGIRITQQTFDPDQGSFVAVGQHQFRFANPDKSA